jgi:hypothetical protein
MKRALFSVLALALALPAQTQVTVPNIPSFVNVDKPFPAGLGRYQQWFSAQALQAQLPEPVRFTQVEFFAGTPPTTQAAQLTVEVLMAHGRFSGVTGAFANNYDDTPVVVRPPVQLQLNAQTSGQVAITIPFTTQFTWDRTRPVLMEIRVHGNSLGSQPFPYNFRGTLSSNTVTHRVFANGVGATNGTVAQGGGMITRFTTCPCVMVPFGAGCPSEGGFVPVGTASPLPRPGLVWTHQVANAPSQALGLWVVGINRDPPYPFDLVPLLGGAPSNCLLRMEPLNTIVAMTVGGGAGSGIAQLPINLPATTGYVGLNLFSQWVIFDALAPSGILSTTGALWSIVGSPLGC